MPPDLIRLVRRRLAAVARQWRRRPLPDPGPPRHRGGSGVPGDGWPAAAWERARRAAPPDPAAPDAGHRRAGPSDGSAPVDELLDNRFDGRLVDADPLDADPLDDDRSDADPLDADRSDEDRSAERPAGSGLRAVLLVLAVLAAVVAWWWWQGRPQPIVQPTVLLESAAPMPGLSPPAGASPSGSQPTTGPLTPGAGPGGPIGDAAGTGGPPPTVSGGAAPASAAAIVVVHVVGPVRRPGVVRLPLGARVIDAVQAAGGLRTGASLGPVNLARPLVDGEQVVIGPHAAASDPARPAGQTPEGQPTAGAGTDPSRSGPLDLNTATPADLETLPGVGPVLAQRIVDWRTVHGGFRAVDELTEVSGIGPARFAELAPLVTV